MTPLSQQEKDAIRVAVFAEGESDTAAPEPVADCATKPAAPPSPFASGASLKEQKAKTEFQLIRYSDIKAKKIEWLWKHYFALGKLTMLNGEPGNGKSLLAIDLAARLSRGLPWPDGSPNTLPPSSIIFLTQEEDEGDTVKPRFLAAGGDEKKLIKIENPKGQALWIEKHCPVIQKLVETGAPDTKLLIIDPVADYTAAEQNKDEQVRLALMQLIGLIQKLNIAALGIRHLNKRSDVTGIQRVSGATGWSAVARLNYMVGNNDGLRILAPLKLNVCKGENSLSYEIGSAQVRSDGLVLDDIARIEWKGKSAVSAEDLTARMTPESKVEQEEDIGKLKAFLADGAWHPKEEVRVALGFSETKCKRLLRQSGASYEWRGMPARTFWRLVDQPGAMYPAGPAGPAC